MTCLFFTLYYMFLGIIEIQIKIRLFFGKFHPLPPKHHAARIVNLVYVLNDSLYQICLVLQEFFALKRQKKMYFKAKNFPNRTQISSLEYVLYVHQKCLVYICTHLTPVFRLHNIHLEFSTSPHKFKWIGCTEKPVSNTSFQDF